MRSNLLVTTALAGICFLACSEDSDSVAGHEEDSGIVAGLDTVFVHDSVKVKDTVNVHDTISILDTISLRDTLNVHDTVTVRDTIGVHDTVSVRDTLNVHDTLNVLDTVTVKDTVNIHDTIGVASTASLTGVAQKGPFVAGSKISVYTLEGSEGLGEKAVSIGNVVTEDDGSYTVEGVSLSTRVSVSVKGGCRNERTGDVENYWVDLRAVAELDASQSNANVNVATELEYDRVDYLLRNNPGMTFAEAKKQAQKEVFAIFDIDASDFANSENLNIFGSSDGDAALLAVSVILEMASKYTGWMTVTVDDIGSDIAEDGKLDNETLLMLVPSDLMALDLRGGLDGIEKNIESWGFGKGAANFKKYIRQYWQANLGFGECGSAAAPEGTTIEYGSSVYKCVEGDWKFDAELTGVELFTDSRDGQVYKMVTVGGQTWMAENLNYELKLEQENGDMEKFSWCAGGDSATKAEGDCSVYGRLYTWAGAVDSAGEFSDGAKGCGNGVSCALEKVRGVCPEDWHLPTNEEWNALFESLGGKSVAGKKLKATGGWLGTYVDGVFRSGNGTDDIKFSALPGGWGSEMGFFYDVGHAAYYISATEISDGRTYYSMIRDESDEAEMYAYGKAGRYSVRCVKD